MTGWSGHIRWFAPAGVSWFLNVCGLLSIGIGFRIKGNVNCVKQVRYVLVELDLLRKFLGIIALSESNSRHYYKVYPTIGIKDITLQAILAYGWTYKTVFSWSPLFRISLASARLLASSIKNLPNIARYTNKTAGIGSSTVSMGWSETGIGSVPASTELVQYSDQVTLISRDGVFFFLEIIAALNQHFDESQFDGIHELNSNKPFRDEGRISYRITIVPRRLFLRTWCFSEIFRVTCEVASWAYSAGKTWRGVNCWECKGTIASQAVQNFTPIQGLSVQESCPCILRDSSTVTHRYKEKSNENIRVVWDGLTASYAEVKVFG